MTLHPCPLAVDTLDMWAATAGLPEQVEAAVSAARGLSDLPSHDRVENVVVLGMGGSGIAGDVLVAAAAPFMPVPVTVVKGYVPPGLRRARDSLVFAMSFSGNTEETLEAATAAFEAGASLIVVAGGGALVSLAHEWDVPVVPVPDGIPQPRAASGPWPSPRWSCWRRSGCSRERCSGWTRPWTSLRTRRDELVRPGQPGRGAGPPHRPDHPPRPRRRGPRGRRRPAVEGPGQRERQVRRPSATPTRSCATTRWPGGASTGDATRQLITLVNLRHDAEHPQVSRRFDLVAEVLREVVADILEVRAAGEGDLAQLLDLALIGDFVSLHLAGHEGIDPGPIPVLDDIKVQLEARARLTRAAGPPGAAPTGRWDDTPPGLAGPGLSV